MAAATIVIRMLSVNLPVKEYIVPQVISVAMIRQIMVFASVRILVSVNIVMHIVYHLPAHECLYASSAQQYRSNDRIVGYDNI